MAVPLTLQNGNASWFDTVAGLKNSLGLAACGHPEVQETQKNAPGQSPGRFSDMEVLNIQEDASAPGSTSSARSPPIGAVPSVSPPP